MSDTHPLARLAQTASAEALPLARAGLARLRSFVDGATLAMLGPDFEARAQRLAAGLEEGRMDPFGLDLEVAKYAVAVAAFWHRFYFRTTCRGIENVPAGGVLLIANHSGQLPVDAMLIGTAMFLDAEPPRLVRSMVEKWTQTLPFIGTFFQRVGQVVGVPENAERLLSQGEALLVFPEGARGITKPIWRRYELVDFGLGFMRLALATNTPIVPIAVVGGEEQYVNLGNVDRLARLLGMPSFPIVPQWLIPGMQLPLPVRYHLHFGPPLVFEGDPDDEDAAIEKKVAIVRRTIQSMVNRGLRDRRSLFF